MSVASVLLSLSIHVIVGLVPFGQQLFNYVSKDTQNDVITSMSLVSCSSMMNKLL